MDDKMVNKRYPSTTKLPRTLPRIRIIANAITDAIQRSGSIGYAGKKYAVPFCTLIVINLAWKKALVMQKENDSH